MHHYTFRINRFVAQYTTRRTCAVYDSQKQHCSKTRKHQASTLLKAEYLVRNKSSKVFKTIVFPRTDRYGYTISSPTFSFCKFAQKLVTVPRRRRCGVTRGNCTHRRANMPACRGPRGHSPNCSSLFLDFCSSGLAPAAGGGGGRKRVISTLESNRLVESRRSPESRNEVIAAPDLV